MGRLSSRLDVVCIVLMVASAGASAFEREWLLAYWQFGCAVAFVLLLVSGKDNARLRAENVRLRKAFADIVAAVEGRRS